MTAPFLAGPGPEPEPGRIAPAAARNRQPILDVLTRVLPPTGLVLEIASGSGEHALWFSTALPHLEWQPSDQDPDALASIAAWRAHGPRTLLAPLHLDAASPAWPLRQADAVIAINMVHIAPWAATQGLMAGAAAVLPPGGALILYGPFREAGVALAPGNQAFDAGLRQRNPDWGLRTLEDVTALAVRHGLLPDRRVPMPANNLTVVFRRG